ncbi:hypothetical protein BDV29DRAFT_137202 [Aspergillus leporis]|jgi:hypothetical protein|uniref:Xylanolytic transcriptional activator regulatory domain-containing protein n=1 Tax=Aspergillus leporis TaxID=41062 RepID=A0A5N5XHT4_9EURO|nr:hypothetical protein BDV29DRAFT_137202 [Aspergillus leporis]
MSLSEDPYETNRGLGHGLNLKSQAAAWNGGSMYMALPSAGKICQTPQIQVSQRDDSGSYEKSTQLVSAATDQIDLSVERPADYAHSTTMFNSVNTDADMLDLLLNFPSEQMSGAGSVVHHGPTVPWSDNGISDRLTVDSCSEAGSTSYPDQFPHKVAKIQNFWSSSQHIAAGAPAWYEIALGSADNIFSSPEPVASMESSNGAHSSSNAEICLTHGIKIQLRSLKRILLRRQCSCPWSKDQFRDTCDQHYFCQNSSDIFEQGLYLYLDKYQPTYPILHVPTFDPRTVQTLQLFLMCTIGLSFVKTEEAARFICHIYPVCEESAS